MPLPPQKQVLLDAELEPEEKLLWAGEPDPKIAARQGTAQSIFGLFWTVGMLNFARISWNAGRPTDHSTLIGTAAILVPMLLIGLYMLFMPALIYYKFSQTIYAITSQRVIIMTGGKSREVESYVTAKIGTLTRTDQHNGTGHLTIAYHASGDPESNQAMFFAIPDVRGVETILSNVLIANIAPKTNAQEV